MNRGHFLANNWTPCISQEQLGNSLVHTTSNSKATKKSAIASHHCFENLHGCVYWIWRIVDEKNLKEGLTTMAILSFSNRPFLREIARWNWWTVLKTLSNFMSIKCIKRGTALTFLVWTFVDTILRGNVNPTLSANDLRFNNRRSTLYPNIAHHGVPSFSIRNTTEKASWKKYLYTI